MNIVQRIREMLPFKGANTLAELERDAGISNGTIGKWGIGEHGPSVKTLEKLAVHLEVTTDYLMGKSDMIDLNVRGIRRWANNNFFSDDESRRIEAHFQELLIRYKDYVNTICDLRTGVSGEVNLGDIQQQSEAKLELLHAWMSVLPNYFFGYSSRGEKLP